MSRRVPALAVVALALLTGACGREEDPPAAAAPTASGTTQAPAATTGEPGPTATAEADPPASAAGFRLVPVAEGFEQPVLVTAAADDARLFVVEQTGRIWILRDGRRAEEPFLDLSAEISTGGERGLLGMALAPDFVRSGRFVVNYTNEEGDTRVVRYRARGGGDVADPASAEVLLAIDQPYPNHNGGHVLYGPDGMLWVGMGDGGAAGDPEDRAQDPQELLGKLLRIDTAGRAGDRPYRIPADNPFSDGGGAPEVWALGMRNPWRFSFDPATDDLWIGDVGQGSREEIDRVDGPGRPGENYGWDTFEGTTVFTEGREEPTRLVQPVAEYDHSDGSCSVTGGVVVRDPAVPALAGRYLFSDFCTGFLRALDADAPDAPAEDLTEAVGGSLGSVSSFGVDGQGRVHVVEHGGTIRRFAAAG